jgi:hypothetical protein
MNRMQNTSGLGPPSFNLNKPQSKAESVADARKKQLESHYGEDWTEADKKLFDAMVKEEMSKVERGFKQQLSLEDSNPVKGNYGARDLSGRDENKDYNTSFDLPQGNRQLSGTKLAQYEPSTKAPQSLSKSDRYYAERGETNEQSFTSKLGEYENSNRDHRRSRQQEYARQLSEQVSSHDSQGYAERDVVGRASSRNRTGRANTMQSESSYQGSGTGLILGTDPDSQRRLEKMKKQEYARQLGQQVSYQKTNNHLDGAGAELSNRSRSYSDARVLLAKDASPISPMRKKYSDDGYGVSGRAPYADSSVTGFQIGQDAADDKRRKKERQQDYYRQLSLDINDRSSVEASTQFQTRRPSRIRNLSDEQPELPGGGILNIGERQPIGRNPSRSRSMEDQESVEKRRLAQQDYFRMLEQDKLSQDSSSPAAPVSKYQSRDAYDAPSAGYGTGLNIGRESADRRVKQQEYREALQQDAYGSDRQPQPMARQYSGRAAEPSVNRYAYDQPTGGNYARQSSYEDDRQTGARNPPARVDFTSMPRNQPIASRSSMGDIIGGSAPIPGLSSYSSGSSGRVAASGYQPSQGLPRSESNFRTRGTSTGGGASTLVLG